MQTISGCNRSLRSCVEVKVKTTKQNAALQAGNGFCENASCAPELSWCSKSLYEIGNTAFIVCSFFRLIGNFETFIRYSLVIPKGK